MGDDDFWLVLLCIGLTIAIIVYGERKMRSRKNPPPRDTDTKDTAK